MKPFILKVISIMSVCMIITACGQSGPSDTDVLNAYKDWASSQAKLGQQVRQLPGEATVDHCKKDPDQPRGKAVLFNCYIRFGGAKDTNLNPFNVTHEPDGSWVP